MRQLLLCFLLLKLATAQSQFATNSKPSIRAAQNLLESLSPEQKRKGAFPFDDSTRTRWSNLPTETYARSGLRLDELSGGQKQLLHALLRSVLSVQGYQKVLFIIQYDEDTKARLAAANNSISSRYGQEKYWVSIFGTPDTVGVWGWKFEGHHLSLNFTHAPEKTTCTPMFIGINPALTESGPFAGRYIMEEENEFGKLLFASLSPEQKAKATLGKHPENADPMAQTGRESFLNEESGISFGELNREQRDLLTGILMAWARNLNNSLAANKLSQLYFDKKAIRFAWLGSDDPNALHYFRVFHPGKFCIELTNRDGGVQHLHGLWRVLGEDFGQ